MDSLIQKIQSEYNDRSICVTETDLDFPGPRIVFVTKGFTELLGYTEEEIIGKTPRIFQGPHTDRATLDRLKSELKEKGSFQGHAINYKKDGREFEMAWSISSIKDHAGVVQYYIALQTDATATVTLGYIKEILEKQLHILEKLNAVVTAGSLAKS